MVIIAIDNAQEMIRGMLTRWMIEIKPGVFVGKLSSRVRGYLWENIIQSKLEQSAVMAFSYPSEQGYIIQSYGDSFRHVCEFDGLQLIGNFTNRRQSLHKTLTNEMRSEKE